jgi:hypothetical protein
MSKKHVDPSLINFSFEPIKKFNRPYVERKRNNKPIVHTKIVRGDLVNVEPVRNLDYYINNNNIRQKKNYVPKYIKKENDLSIQFVKGSKYKITKPITTINKVVERIPVNQFEGCIEYKRDRDDEIIPKKETVTITILKNEKQEYNPELYKKFYDYKGEKLVEELGNTDNVEPEYLLKYICDVTPADDFSWLEDNEYGLGLKYLVKDNTDKQHAIINVLVTHLDKLKFPKVNNTYLIVILFNKLISKEIVEIDILLEWKDTQDDCTGKMKAIVQTSEWFLNLLKMLEESEEETDMDDLENY